MGSGKRKIVAGLAVVTKMAAKKAAKKKIIKDAVRGVNEKNFPGLKKAAAKRAAKKSPKAKAKASDISEARAKSYSKNPDKLRGELKRRMKQIDNDHVKRAPKPTKGPKKLTASQKVNARNAGLAAGGVGATIRVGSGGAKQKKRVKSEASSIKKQQELNKRKMMLRGKRRKK